MAVLFLLPQIVGGLLSKGKKPVVPDFVPVDASKTQKETVAGNMAAFSDASKMASMVNAFEQEELDKAILKNFPGFKEAASQISENINSQLRGELPKDVEESVLRSAAARNLFSGTAGTGFARNLVARDLGMTSLQISQQGLESAMRWLGTVRGSATAPQLGVANMFFSPQQRLAHEVGERDKKFDIDLAKAKVAAMPDPTKAAIGQAIIKTDDQIMSMASSAAGSAVGMLCWVAQEVYGQENPRWMMFRDWMLNDAPNWLLKLYIRFGPRFARWIKNKPRIKRLVKKWMDSKIKE